MNVANTQPSKPTSRLRSRRSKPAKTTRSERKAGTKITIPKPSRAEVEAGVSKVKTITQKIWRGIKSFFGHLGGVFRDAWQSFLRSFARWSDPKLEPYRERTRADLEQEHPVPPASQDDFVVVEEEIYSPAAPETREDLFALIREAPITVLTGQERKAMAAILNLPDVPVTEIMTPKAQMVFVDKYETLGPLILDRLYKSGFTYFPVVDSSRCVIGTLQTSELNSLSVKETKQAHEVMSSRVFYIRADYSLEAALKAFVRTGTQLMLVIDDYEKLVGMLSLGQVLNYLFSERYEDDFARDDDRIAVAKRKSFGKSK